MIFVLFSEKQHTLLLVSLGYLDFSDSKFTSASETDTILFHTDSIKSIFHSSCIVVYLTKCLTLFTRNPSLKMLFFLSAILFGVSLQVCSGFSVWRVLFLFLCLNKCVTLLTHTHTHTLLNTFMPIPSCSFCRLSHEGALTPWHV